MNISFSGKRALVTGAGRGIGRSVALRLAECGAEVVAVSRTQSTLESLKQECPSIQTICCDLSNWKDTSEALAAIGVIHLLVNNAGTNVLQPFLEIEEDAFNTIFDVNVKSVLHVSQLVCKSLVACGQPGSVVNVSSQASTRFIPDHLVYSCSKAALEQMTKSMSAELGKHQIRVNAVSPTVVLTDLGKRDWSDPSKAGPMLARIPLGRFSEVSECVDAILYLLSDKSSMITGAVLPVDGGFWTT